MRRAGESGRVIAGVFLLSLLSLGMPALMAAGPGVATYEYDNLGRIKSVTYEDGSGQSYTYDKAGNRQTSGPLTSGGILQFGQASYSVVEGQPSATLSVTRTGSTASAITVHYKTTDGTAAAGSDYTAADSTLSWAAGDSAAKTISIPIADDSAIESIETFTVTLSGPTGGAALGAVTQATVSITDNDSVNFSVSDTSVVEGNTPSGTSATFTITRAGGSGTAYTVQYATAGITATSGTDFTATSGTASFAATEMTKQITVPIIGDAVYEGTETFKLVLSAPSGGATLSKPEGIATIQEDDTPPVFAVANASIVEGNSGTTVLTFTVTKSGATALSHVVTFSTHDGSATAGNDYVANNGTVSFAPGDTSKPVAVTVVGETTFEPDETFTLRLDSVSGGATISATSGVATGTIQNDDAPPAPGKPQFKLANETFQETTASINLMVSRVGGSAGAVSVDCKTADGTAFAGSDYVSTSVTLTWQDGETFDQACPVSIIDDIVAEPPETFTASLSNYVGTTAPTSGTTETVTIISDELPPAGTLQFDVASKDVSENGGSVLVHVTRIDGSYGAANATCATTPGTANSPAEFIATNQVLQWGDGDTTPRDCVVTINDDTVYDGNKTFTLGLTAFSGATAGTPSNIPINILDNEPRPMLSIDDITVREDAGAATFTVTMSAVAGAAMSVHFATSDGTATSVAGRPDYFAISSQLSFAPGETSKTITVTLDHTGAGVWEGDEYFNVTLSAATGGALISKAVGTATLLEVDAPPQFNITDAIVTEGGQLQFAIGRAGLSDIPQSVTYSTADGTATAPDDYQAISGTVTFQPGDTQVTVVVQTQQDDIVEAANDTMYVYLSSPTSGAVVGRSPGVGVIADDDSNIPSTPPNLRTDPPGSSHGGFTALWDASGGPVSYYELIRSQDPTFATFTTFNIQAPATSLFFPGVPSGDKDFYFFVRACNASAECSAYSNETVINVCGGRGCTN